MLYDEYDKALYKINVAQSNTGFSGSIDTIVPEIAAESISTGSITSELQQDVGNLRNGKTLFDNSQTGFILGVDKGTAKFYIGDATNYLNWTGTALAIAGEFSISSGTIGGWTINSTSIYTGTEDHSGYTANAGDLTIYSDGSDASIHAKNFYIDSTGALFCTASTVSGALTTTAGSSINGTYIDSLTVDKLATGTISSKQITLAIAAGTGDVYIASGKTDFTNTQSGFILGVDDSDSDKAKLYIGDATNYLNWDATNLTVTGIITAVSGSSVAGTSTDTFTINSDLTDANVDLVLGRTTGGSATVRWNGTNISIDKSLTIPDGGTIGLGAGKGLIQFDDETTDFISFSNCNVGIGTTSPNSKLDISNVAENNSYIRLSKSSAPTTYWAIRRNDTTTGHFEIGDNFGTKLVITENTGNVGIGTTAPGYLLDVNGTFRAVGATTLSSTLGVAGKTTITVADASPTTGEQLVINHAGSGGQASSMLFESNGVDIARVGTNNSLNLLIETLYNDSDIILDPAGTGDVIINSGNVGIGTTSPNSKLDISNVAENNSYIRLSKSSAPTTYWAIRRNDTTTGHFEIGDNFGTKLVITENTGNVGIGTTAPDRALEINSATGACLRLTYNDSNGSATVYSDFSVSSGGNLTVAPTGDFIFNPVGNDILPNTGYDLNIGSLSAKYLTLHAAELWVETLVAQNTIATIGGRILVGPTTALTRDLTDVATTIYVKYNEMASGDRTYMEANGKVEFFAITSSGSLQAEGDYAYTVTRNLDGSGANSWNAGDAMFNTGTTGDGFIDIYSVAGIKAGTEYGPAIAGNVRNSATYNDWTTYWAIGNLNGLYGYGVTTYGVAFGKYSGANYMTVDATNGIRFLDTDDVVRGQLTSTTWTLGSTASEHVSISSTAVQIKDGATVYTDLTAGALSLGDTANEHTLINSSGVAIKDNTSVYALFATTTTIGLTASEHISISSTAVQIKDGASIYTDLTAGVLTLGLVSGGEYITVDGTNGIKLYGGGTENISLSNAGVITIGEVGASKSNILLSSNAIYLRTNTTNKITLGTDGNISLTGNLSVGTSGAFYSGQTAYNTGTGFWWEYNGGTPRMSIGDGGVDNWLTWDGTQLQASLLITSNKIQVTTLGEDATVGYVAAIIHTPYPSSFAQAVGEGFFGDTVVGGNGVKRAIRIVGNGTSISTIKLALKKSGSPSDNAVIRIETDSSGVPSGTLVHANATASIAGASLTTSFVDTTVTFAGAFTVPTAVCWIVCQRDGALDNSNMYQVGYRFTAKINSVDVMRTYNGTNWTTFDSTESRCYFYCAGAITSDMVVRANSTYEEQLEVIGLFNATKTAGSNVMVQIDGVDLNQSGLIVPTRYYVNGDGLISNTPGTYKKGIGNAVTTTSIKLEPFFIRSIAPVSSLTLGASPSVYQNTGGECDVIVNGGTVSAIEFSRDGGGTYYTIQAATNGMFHLSPYDYLKITYSSVPTVTRVPR